MKKIRIPFAVLLILLTAFAWTNQIGKLRSNEKNFTALCEKAQAYAENKLYQKAAETYEDALFIKESAEIRAAQIAAYRDGTKPVPFRASSMRTPWKRRSPKLRSWRPIGRLLSPSKRKTARIPTHIKPAAKPPCRCKKRLARGSYRTVELFL